MTGSILTTHNADPVDIQNLPSLTVNDFREAVIQRTNQGERIVALFAQPLKSEGQFHIIAILANGGRAFFLFYPPRADAIFPLSRRIARRRLFSNGKWPSNQALCLRDIPG